VSSADDADLTMIFKGKYPYYFKAYKDLKSQHIKKEKIRDEKELKAKLKSVASCKDKLYSAYKCILKVCCKKDIDAMEKANKIEQEVNKRTGKELWAIAKSLV